MTDATFYLTTTPRIAELRYVREFIRHFVGKFVRVATNGKPLYLVGLDAADNLKLGYEPSGPHVGVWSLDGSLLSFESLLGSKMPTNVDQRLDAMRINNAAHLAASEGDLPGYEPGPMLSLGATIIRVHKGEEDRMPRYAIAESLTLSPVHLANYDRLMQGKPAPKPAQPVAPPVSPKPAKTPKPAKVPEPIKPKTIVANRTTRTVTLRKTP